MPTNTILRDRFELTRVHILESLATGLHTGRQLFTALQSTDEIPDAIVYHEIFNSADLTSALERIALELRQEGSIPLIHIEAHGSPEGLHLASNDFIPWDAILTIIRPITIASNFNVLLYLAACQTEWVLGSVRSTQPAPFGGCMVYSGDVSAGEIADHLVPFYTSILSGQTIDQAQAAAAVAAHPGTAESHLKFWSAQEFLIRAFAAYILQHGDNTTLLHRAANIAAATGQQMDLAAIINIKDNFLTNHEQLFEKHRTAFFMYDRFPENKARFPAPFDLVKLLLSSGEPIAGDSSL